MCAIIPRDVGSCSYAGTGYANPHAVTGIKAPGGATTTYAYDNNGNITSATGKGYAWDYRNRLSAAGAAGATTTYAYDHENQRVLKKTSTETTTYVNMYYNVASSSAYATTTKHIFTPSGELLATVIGTSSAATTTYLHLDHLGGTNVATDGNQATSQVLDYYPYGSQRIATGSFSEQRKFTGHEYDQENDLTYANARYYEQNVAKWLSQDPASRDNPGQFLVDPQQLNSYSYARNNPIRLLDQSGEVTIEFSRPLESSLFGWAASHNAIAGYNVPGFPKGVMTFAGYDSRGPAAYNRLVMENARSGDSALSKQDFGLAQQIFAGDISGVRGFTLIKDFGGITEEEYWQKLIQTGAHINLQGVPYSAISQNSHSGLNTSKTYANPSSSPYTPTHPWLGLPWLTPASGNNVLQSGQSGSGSSGSSQSINTFGLAPNAQITASNVGAFVSFIKQFS